MESDKILDVGKTYYVAYDVGWYGDVNYAERAKCIKKTPKSYRMELANGKTFLVGKDSIRELREL
ncbi:hypothetical protein [Methylophilus flavus]|uniref:hypothetical protein n=1 Tax=Methylophilus flavus TaxID=640084 RepID=UPI0036734A92